MLARVPGRTGYPKVRWLADEATYTCLSSGNMSHESKEYFPSVIVERSRASQARPFSQIRVRHFIVVLVSSAR